MCDDIINEYLGEITKEMGVRQRGDVARELRTHILDSADALAAEKKAPVNDAIVREVIARMGPAEKIAALYPSRKTFFKKNGMWDAIKALAMLAIVFLMVPLILALVVSPSLTATTQILFTIAGALVLAIIVIAVIFFCIYLYESRLKATYASRLKAFERRLNDRTTPINIAVRVAATVFWLALLNIFWARAPFILSFGPDTTLVPLLTDRFAPFVLYLNAIGIVTVVLALSYPLIRQKWVPSLIDAALSLCNALLFIWILAVFPVNPALAAGPATMIRLVLAIIVFGCLVATAKQLWDTMKFALYGRIEKSDAV